MKIGLFRNSSGHLRNGWWVLVFFGALALQLFPALLLAQHQAVEIHPLWQAAFVLVATWICQIIRRKPLTEITGTPDLRWPREFFIGGLVGATLMLLPALLLGLLGQVTWHWNPAGVSAVGAGVLAVAGTALAEETLFRGFLFQRTVAGIGAWPAQLLLGAYFLLTHLNNPGMTGGTRILAGTNIFLASILFGLALLRTRSLAMPLGLHFMANWTQGDVLGFGVSGTSASGFLIPTIAPGPWWLSGGEFGLEASGPGLICVMGAIILLYRWPQQSDLATANAGRESKET